MKSTGATRPAWLGDDRGVAAMEFVLALPFIWLILVFTFNFGQAFLERQRTHVALREMAIRHTAEVAAKGEDNTPINPIADALQQDTFARRNMNAQFFLDRVTAGTCPAGEGGAPDDSWFDGAMETLGDLLKNLSSSHSYEVVAEGPPTVGRQIPALFGRRVLPQPQHNACLVMDNNPWTIHETGTPTGWLKEKLGVLGDILDALL